MVQDLVRDSRAVLHGMLSCELVCPLGGRRYEMGAFYLWSRRCSSTFGCLHCRIEKKDIYHFLKEARLDNGYNHSTRCEASTYATTSSKKAKKRIAKAEKAKKKKEEEGKKREERKGKECNRKKAAKAKAAAAK